MQEHYLLSAHQNIKEALIQLRTINDKIHTLSLENSINDIIDVGERVEALISKERKHEQK
jgi:hypothetical protein